MLFNTRLSYYAAAANSLDLQTGSNMIKLSRRNWNNVLIFVVLILMFFLYGIPQRLLQSEPEHSRLVPEQSQLLMVSFGQHRLTQAGSQWRIQPAVTSNNTAIDATKLALAWQHTLLVAADSQSLQTKVPIAQASVQLVGQFEPMIWLLYPTEQGYLLQQAGATQLFALSAEQASQLFLLP